MPSEKILENKKKIVAELTDILKNSVSGVLVDYKGITVEEDTKLRQKFREANVQYMVVKNNLLRFALRDSGYSELEKHLEGTTSLAVSKTDPIIPAKIISEFSDEKKDIFNIKAGFIEGEILDAQKVSTIGKLPSKEQLVAQLLSVMTGNIRGLAVALNAISEQKSE